MDGREGGRGDGKEDVGGWMSGGEEGRKGAAPAGLAEGGQRMREVAVPRLDAARVARQARHVERRRAEMIEGANFGPSLEQEGH